MSRVAGLQRRSRLQVKMSPKQAPITTPKAAPGAYKTRDDATFTHTSPVTEPLPSQSSPVIQQSSAQRRSPSFV